MDCYETVDLMGDAVEGRLQPALQPGFDEHIRECGPCGNYLEHLRITRGVLRHLSPEGADPPRMADLLREFRARLGGDREEPERHN